jgi:archaellum component FlaG (FlaF/FlaG flagellin family)
MILYRVFLSILFLFVAASLSAQTYKVYGKISTTKMEGIGYASIEVKDIRLGTITKNDGEYQLFLEAGKHELVITMLGYQSQTLSIVIEKDYQLNIILEEESKNLSEVIVRAKAKDRAEEVVRNVIRNKEAILAATGAYSYNLYIKAIQQDSSSTTKRGKIVKIDSAKFHSQNTEFSRMAMVEILARVDQGSDTRIKEERTGVKRNGNAQGLFYLSATDGNFNFYNNLIKVPTLSSMPFVSPVSYSGLVAYKFKTLKVERTGKHKIYTISVPNKTKFFYG